MRSSGGMKWIDLPPIWLAGFIAAAYLLGDPVGLGAWGRLPGILLILTGVGLMGLAVIEMARHRTTVIPHRDPDRLVASGIFGLTRNPIYLGDALVLTGCIFLFGSPVTLVLVPAFMIVIRQRFILPEEERLRAGFGAEFDAYAKRVRRWI